MFKRFLIFLIKIYQASAAFRKPHCRFIPSCSAYAVEAIKKYGALKGSILSFKRVIKCRPGFGKYKNCGYDPVP
ncbi:MAG: membrane protein insertion efficiency factor YidD [Holosporales bacterium]|nr:membrane protein insertion efficiency factor YidD [Holosporales bacterium]